MGIKQHINTVIFGVDTPAGKLFDVVLIGVILASVAVVMADSVGSINLAYGEFLRLLEWIFTIIFTIEYALRIYASPKRWGYIKSFFGIIDLIAVIPTYLSLLAFSTATISVFRVLRVLRVFRILKLASYLRESQFLIKSLKGARRKITVFLSSVLTLVVILGSMMYMIESPESGFTSIPKSIYWAIVTLTTVGYGDISPVTPLGQLFASTIMILGYGIIAVPAGLVTSEMMALTTSIRHNFCPKCDGANVPDSANFCPNCGNPIKPLNS